MTPGQLASHIAGKAASIAQLPVVTGFDGFVDEMITVVEERENLERYRRVEDITRFGQLITAAAGHSSLREIVVTRTDPGGCAINLGDGLATLGVPVTTFATAGEPVHAAFQDYGNKATLHTWGREPGRTLAYEFADGKLMFSAVSQLAEFTPDYVSKRLSEGVFQQACATAQVIALTDWTLYPHMTACWQLLQQSVFNTLTRRPIFFIDLVDPSSRSTADITAMLAVLPGFSEAGSTVLGLNQNEANILTRITGGSIPSEPEASSASQQAAFLREQLQVDEVVIHGVKYAVTASAGSTAEAEGPYCAKPYKLTGAGDRFNAGYTLGLLLQLAPKDRLVLASATSGFYVRQGRSATFTELVTFLELWEKRALHD